ncbi:MAG: metallophosphoesterase [Planctomycetota bacterium]
MTAAVVLLVVAAAGHAAIWVAVINRTHATGWPHSIVSKIDKLFFLLLLAPPPMAVYWLLSVDAPSLMPWRVFSSTAANTTGILALEGYLGLCWISAVVILVQRLRWAILQNGSSILRFHRSRSLATNILHSPDHPHHAIVHLPGNESLELDLIERGLDVPRLPPALEGLSIVHLSDFHFTGRIGRPFFEEIVRMSNALEPEIVVLTGDLVDKTQFIDWVPDTFGRLKARYGVYYLFGNHDLRVDYRRLQRVMVDCGLVYLGGCWKVIKVRGQPVLVAGNELPWFKPAADLSTFPPRSEVPFRLLLAHSPDQLPWARKGDGDLLLAGHTHGGQIRLPLIGPVFAPSYNGVQYASGLFYAPPTILNVSCGLSAELPLRMNCAPEIIHLTLHGGHG